MPKYKATYHGPFSHHSEIISADSLDDAEKLAHLGSVYRNITVEESFDDQESEHAE